MHPQKEDTAFPLVKLPYDLIEYLNDFFDARESLPLLTVSRLFHEVFSRSTWRVIKWHTLGPQRLVGSSPSTAIAHYGRHVRQLSMVYAEGALAPSVDWSALFPNITQLAVAFAGTASSEFNQSLLRAVVALPALHTLSVCMGHNYPPYHLGAIASALVERYQSRRYCGRIKRLSLVYADSSYDRPWHAVEQFTERMLELGLSQYEVYMRAFNGLLESPVQAAALRPYLREIGRHESTTGDVCYSKHNSILFGTDTTQCQMQAFPQLKALNVTTCCARSHQQARETANPTLLPALAQVRCIAMKCAHAVDVDDANQSSAANILLSRNWTNAVEFQLHGHLNRRTLEAAFNIHTQIMYLQLTVGSGLAINGAFDLSIITDSLPNLVKLVVGPDPFSPPSENWTLQHLSSEPRSRVEFVDIKSARLATSAVRMLFKMPSLKTVQLRFCSMSNRAEVSTLLHQIQCDSSGEYPTSISDLCILMSEVEQEWPIDFLLSVLDAMKHLSLLRIKSEREAVRRSVVERYPHLKLKFETVTPLNTPVPEHMQQPAEAEEPPIHPEPVDQPV